MTSRFAERTTEGRTFRFFSVFEMSSPLIPMVTRDGRGNVDAAASRLLTEKKFNDCERAQTDWHAAVVLLTCCYSAMLLLFVSAIRNGFGAAKPGNKSCIRGQFVRWLDVRQKREKARNGKTQLTAHTRWPLELRV